MLTFETCANLIKNRQSKKLANNTYLTKDGDSFIVTLHSTAIIKILSDDTLILNSGGYRTKTTKSRLNEYVSNKIHQEKGIWYINGIAFYDGIKIGKDGKLIDAIDNTVEVERKKKELDKMVKNYIKSYIDYALEHGVKRSNGDCWFCLFQHNNSLEHIYSHLVENYYFGSFLDVAIKGSRYTPYLRTLIEHQLMDCKTDFLKRVLTSYFMKIKPNLMEFHCAN